MSFYTNDLENFPKTDANVLRALESAVVAQGIANENGHDLGPLSTLRMLRWCDKCQNFHYKVSCSKG